MVVHDLKGLTQKEYQALYSGMTYIDTHIDTYMHAYTWWGDTTKQPPDLLKKLKKPIAE